MSSPTDPGTDRVDQVLRTVVAEGRRRQQRRTRLVTGLGAVGAAVLLLASAVALARTGGSEPVAGPVTSTAPSEPSTGGGTSTTAAPIAGGRPLPTSALVKVGAEGVFLATIKREALAEVTAFGLPSVGAYGGGPVFAGRAVSAPAMAGPSGGAATTVASAQDSAEKSSAGSSAGAPGADFSGTNNQEKGVDEADSVKTDGKHLFTATGPRVEIVDVASADPKVVGRVELGTESVNGMLLAADRLLVFSTVFSEQPYPQAKAGARTMEMPAPSGKARLRIVDVKDAARPKVVATTDLDGRYVDARLIDGSARLVLASSPKIVLTQAVDDTLEAQAQALAENKRRIGESKVDAWLPQGASADRTYRTQAPTGLDVVSVRSVDPVAGTVGPAVSVVAGAQVVYASTSSLYVATNEYGDVRAAQEGRTTASTPHTSLHKFNIRDPKTAVYVGSGDTVGTVLNQFSLSEAGDALRVATTTFPTFGGGVTPLAEDSSGPATSPAATTVPSTALTPTTIQPQQESAVVTFRPSGGALVEVGRVGGLGRGERIYAVRFIGDRGYVVTFRQVDPLYVIDLADPARPRLTGELKINGYSSYLHPVGDHQLLGVGTAASDQGRRQGFQISLFDVKDPSTPKVLSTQTIANGSSLVEGDHHAFLWWAPAGLALVPVQTYDQVKGQSFGGVVGYGVSSTAIAERGRISHPGLRGSDPAGYSPQVERSIVVGDRIFTVSQAGVLASDLRTLKSGSFASFG